MSDATPAAAQEDDSCELGTGPAGLGQADAGTLGPLDPEAVAARPEVEGELESRLAFTPAALDLINRLWELHGPLMFHQSGGCCDGSSPMCYPAGEFQTGPSDVLLGTVDVGDDGDVGGNHRAEAFGGGESHFKGSEVAVVDADELDVGNFQCSFGFGFVVNFDEGGQS